MSKDLIIVESPAKVKTISKFLGKDYRVEASVGHVRDLPRQRLGVDEEHGFEPQYEVIQGKEEVVKKLRKAAKGANHVYLAPDPDREGEAIAWHVAELIKNENTNVSRIQFNEITKRAILEALEHPKPLDGHLFDSQQARRILDRLVGYKISPILWKKVKRGISAGRVQSVALKLLVEREKERRAFDPVEYWLFKATVQGQTPPPFGVDLWKYQGKAVKPGGWGIGNAEDAEALDKTLRETDFVVQSVEEKQRQRQPKPPFITSTLQQEANNRLGYTAKRTMGAAQRLYEGVELGRKGLTALITYMRTDSVRISDDALAETRELVLSKFGEKYAPAKPRKFKTKGSAQDAHEAIRPVDVTITPQDVKGYLPAEQFKLYSLIWERFVASQMTPAVFWDTTVTIEAADTLWRAKGERLVFAGFLAAMPSTKVSDSELPKLAEGEKVDVQELMKEQKFTQPPPRYTEAALVKELEELGIGRPSTYATIISTLQDRDYVRLEEKRFAPTELGFVVSDQLSEHFPSLMDVGFTAGMENDLDDVADGKQNWGKLMEVFAKDFYPTLDKAQKDMTRAIMETGIDCEKCGKPMVVKFGKTGEFLGCSGYPACRNIRDFTRDEKGGYVIVERPEEEDTGINCEKCGSAMVVKQGRMGEFLGCSGYPDCQNILNFKRDEDGKIIALPPEAQEVVGKCEECGEDMVVKRTRTGSRFIACTGYPKCRNTRPFSTGVKCPKEGCNGELVEKSSRRGKLFYSCSNYPECDYALWDWPVEEACPECDSPLLVKKTTKAKGTHIACPKKGCKYTREVDGE